MENTLTFVKTLIMEATRQKIAAEQIEEAMKARGLSRKQFADLMHRNPSEVTKWLSGKHNFTIALLQEISNVLGVEITGVENIDALIDGFEYGNVQDSLEEPVAVYGRGTGLSRKIKRRYAELGISARKYIEGLVDEEIRKSTELPKIALPDVFDDDVEKFAGVMACPSPEDLANDERLARIWNK